MSRADFGPNGQAQRVRPHRIVETINAGQHQKVMQDGHLIDRLLTTRVLTSGQHEAAQRVLDLHDAAGFEPRQVASYAPLGSGRGHDDNTPERHDIARFRQMLTHASDAEAWALHGLALGDVPSAQGLAYLRRILTRLANRWGF